MEFLSGLNRRRSSLISFLFMGYLDHWRCGNRGYLTNQKCPGTKADVRCETTEIRCIPGRRNAAGACPGRNRTVLSFSDIPQETNNSIPYSGPAVSCLFCPERKRGLFAFSMRAASRLPPRPAPAVCQISAAQPGTCDIACRKSGAMHFCSSMGGRHDCAADHAGIASGGPSLSWRPAGFLKVHFLPARFFLVRKAARLSFRCPADVFRQWQNSPRQLLSTTARRSRSLKCHQLGGQRRQAGGGAVSFASSSAPSVMAGAGSACRQASGVAGWPPGSARLARGRRSARAWRWAWPVPRTRSRGC